MIKLSVIIIALNEEEKIAACISKVSFADEIVLVDGGSKDRTVQKAQEAGARVYHRAFDDFASQRNFGLTKARGEWVLFIDADEHVTSSLRYEIMAAIEE